MADMMNPWAPAQPTMQPGPTMDAQQPNLQQKWESFMSNPVNRSMMVGAGLQLMMGSWGNQVGNAFAAGIDSAAGTEKVMQDQANLDADEQLKRDQLAQQASEGELDRQSRERIAGTYATSREAVADKRIANARNPNYISAYNTAYRSTRQGLELSVMAGEMSQEEAEAAAIAAGERAGLSAMQTVPAGGSGPLPGQGTPGNGNTGSQGGMPGQGQTAATGQRQGSTNAPKTFQYSDLKRRFGNTPGFDEKVAAFEAQGYKVAGKPLTKKSVEAGAPKYGGVQPDGSKESPFASSAQAGRGQHFLKNGEVWYKNVFGQEAKAP